MRPRPKAAATIQPITSGARSLAELVQESQPTTKIARAIALSTARKVAIAFPDSPKYSARDAEQIA